MKQETKSSRIRALVAAGHKPKEIAAMTGFSVNHVYNLMHRDKQRAAAKAFKEMNQVLPLRKKPGRPKGRKNKPKAPPTPEVKKEAVVASVIHTSNTRPNLWARVKAVFTGRYE